MNLPRFAIERKTLVLVALALAVAWSLVSAFTMQRREDPGTTQRFTEIVTAWPGAPVHDVEQLVTKKIGDDLRGVEHVDHVTGTSSPGLSDVFVELDDAVNEHSGGQALQDIRNHLSDLGPSLPAGIDGPRIVPHLWDTYPVVLGISDDELSRRALRDVAKRLGDEISRLPDVGDVQMVGAQEQQVHVDLDLRALTEFGVGAEEIVSALQQRNALIPDASTSFGERNALIGAPSSLLDAAGVAATSVAQIGGRTIRVGDVADVALGYPDPPAEIVRVDGKQGVALAVMAKTTSSVTALGPEIRGLLTRDGGLWPAGIHVAFIADQPTSVSGRLRDFLQNLGLGVFLAFVLVAAFMGARNGLVVGTTIVLSIVLTFGVMPLLSIDLQQISIVALIVGIGMVVDAGIVALDNIEKRLREGKDRFTAAWQGVQELWFPLLTSTLVGMSSFIPFLLLGGAVGEFVHDLGVVVCISVSMSLLVAYFVTPILGQLFARASDSADGNPIMRQISARFDRLLERLRTVYAPVGRFALERPWIVAGTAVGMTVIAVASIPLLGQQFFPPADRNQFVIDLTAPNGTAITATAGIARRAEELVSAQPGVTTIGTFVGHGAPKFYYNIIPHAPASNYAQLVVDTTDVATANRLVDVLRADLRAQIAGARADVKRLEQGPPVGAPIQLRVSGDDRAALASAAQQVTTILVSVPGTLDVRDSQGTPTTKFDVLIDEGRVAQAGTGDAAVRSVVNLAYGGLVATSLREPDRETQVVVRLPVALRADEAALSGLPLRSSGGGVVPLAEVAAVQPAGETSATVLRDGKPTITVQADVNGRLASDALADFKSRASGLHLSAGTQLSYAGEEEQSSKALRQLLVAMMVGLFLNQLILVWEFRALRLSLVILGAVPLGLVGAVAGLAITHSSFGFTAALGIAGLGGVITNHTIVLFEYARRELRRGVSLEEALILAGQKRIRPIFLTVATSIAGLLPLALSGGGLWTPFCWAIIFGLLGSMGMTLVAIPAIYRIVGRGSAILAEPELPEAA